jgi:hypothetical protein
LLFAGGSLIGSTVVMKGSFLFFAATFIVFSLHVKEILRKGVKKRYDAGFRFSLYAVGIGTAVAILISATVWFDAAALFTTYLVWAYLVGWLLFTIVGYLFKIVPFLWWTEKYSTRVGKEKVPLLAEMMNERLGNFTFLLFHGAFVLAAISFIAQWFVLFQTAQALFVVASVIYAFNTIHVLKK